MYCAIHNEECRPCNLLLFWHLSLPRYELPGIQGVGGLHVQVFPCGTKAFKLVSRAVIYIKKILICYNVGMARHPEKYTIKDSDKHVLGAWLRSPTTIQCLALRAKIIWEYSPIDRWGFLCAAQNKGFRRNSRSTVIDKIRVKKAKKGNNISTSSTSSTSNF